MPRSAKKGKKGTLVRRYKRFKRSKYLPNAQNVVQAGNYRSTPVKAAFAFCPNYNLRNQYGTLVSNAPVPPRKRFTLKYSETFPPIGLTVGIAGIGGTELLYGLNSLFDPNISGTGHQPFYYDQMIACGYTMYKVEKVSIKVEAVSATNTYTGVMVQVDAWPGTTGQLQGVSWTGAKERPNTWWLRPEVKDGVQSMTIEHLPLHMIQGLTMDEYNKDPAYHAAVSAQPTKIPFLRISAMNIDGGNVGTIWGTIELIFEGEFYQRAVVATS